MADLEFDTLPVLLSRFELNTSLVYLAQLSCELGDGRAGKGFLGVNVVSIYLSEEMYVRFRIR